MAIQILKWGLMALLFSGCTQTMSDFVSGAKRLAPPVTVRQLPGNSEFHGPKVSGGTGTAVGSGMGMTLTVSPTQTALKGTSFGMRLGVSRTSQVPH